MKAEIELKSSLLSQADQNHAYREFGSLIQK